jgi:hypothetical protein
LSIQATSPESSSTRREIKRLAPVANDNHEFGRATHGPGAAEIRGDRFPQGLVPDA